MIVGLADCHDQVLRGKLTWGRGIVSLSPGSLRLGRAPVRMDDAKNIRPRHDEGTLDVQITVPMLV